MHQTIAVVIPTYQASRYLLKLCEKLRMQTRPPQEIIVIDSSSSDDTVQIAQRAGCSVQVIPKREFNHGGTRNKGAALASDSIQILVFMTQDALPANEFFLAELVEPIESERAAGAFARQIPYPEANPLEVLARQFNYPPQSYLKSKADIERMGIKAYFFSDVASAVRRDHFERVGRFPEDMILNEDMLLCVRLLAHDSCVAYQARAEVFHSHEYSIKDQFKRYFDIGVSQVRNKDLVRAKAGGEGRRFVRHQLFHLFKHRQFNWIPPAILEAGAKLLAFHLGMKEQFLPCWVKRRLSMNSLYWN